VSTSTQSIRKKGAGRRISSRPNPGSGQQKRKKDDDFPVLFLYYCMNGTVHRAWLAYWPLTDQEPDKGGYT
jgi:hypothetical protein